MHSLSKKHRLTQVPGPVARIRCLYRHNPGTGNIGQIGNVRRLQVYFAHLLNERCEHGLYQTRMEGVGGMQTMTVYTFAGELSFQTIHSLRGTRNHTEGWTIDRSQREFVSQKGTYLVFW